jgi:hypothetical protein
VKRLVLGVSKVDWTTTLDFVVEGHRAQLEALMLSGPDRLKGPRGTSDTIQDTISTGVPRS